MLLLTIIAALNIILTLISFRSSNPELETAVFLLVLILNSTCIGVGVQALLFPHL